MAEASFDPFEMGGTKVLPHNIGAEYLAQMKAGKVPTDPFIARTLEYIETCDYAATAAEVLAIGVIAVAESYKGGEVSVYFDPTKWALTHPEVWSLASNGTPNCLVTDGLCVISNVISLRSLDGAMGFARTCLTPLGGSQWLQGAHPLF